MHCAVGAINTVGAWPGQASLGQGLGRQEANPFDFLLTLLPQNRSLILFSRILYPYLSRYLLTVLSLYLYPYPFLNYYLPIYFFSIFVPDHVLVTTLRWTDMN